MIVVRTVADLRAALAPARAEGRTVALVPTMGALHAGHRQLLVQARAAADVVVISVFVNPTQFNDPADLAAYPRTEAADIALAEGAGVDIYFAPTPDEVYPEGFGTTVAVSGPLVESFEGAHRTVGHFNGVTTVVTKLLNMVSPQLAFFGQKDAQQLQVIRALVADLNLDVQIVAVPTQREADGLALSSRNVRLSPAERERALGLSRSLTAAATAVAGGLSDARAVEDIARAVLAAHEVVPEYVAVVAPDTFTPLAEIPAGGALLVLAAPVGTTRLIDNMPLHAPDIEGR